MDDIRLWPAVLPRIPAALNNSIKYSSTSLAPTQIMYGFRTREALDLLRADNKVPDEDESRAARPDDHVSSQRPDENSQSPVATHPVTRSATRRAINDAINPPVDPAVTHDPAVGTPVRSPEASVPPAVAHDPTSRPVGRPPSRSQKPSRTLLKHSRTLLKPVAMTDYRPSHIDAKDAIAFAAMRMKAYYDSRHQARFFDVNDLVNLRLNRGYQIPSGLKKIGPQLVGPFKVIERIGRLAYRLELPGNMRIHNAISIAYLEPAPDPSEDPYYRHHSPPPAITVDGEDEYVIEKLVPKSLNEVEEYLLQFEDNVAAGISLPHSAFLKTRVPFFIALIILLPSASIPDSEEDEDWELTHRLLSGKQLDTVSDSRIFQSSIDWLIDS